MQRERKRGERVWEEEEGRSIDGAWISGYFETARLPNCEMNTSLMMCGSVVMISRYEPRYSLVNRLTFFRMFFFSFFEYGNPFLLSKKVMISKMQNSPIGAAVFLLQFAKDVRYSLESFLNCN